MLDSEEAIYTDGILIAILTDTTKALGHVFHEAEPGGSLGGVVVIVVVCADGLGTLGDLLLAPVVLLVAALALAASLAVAPALGTVALPALALSLGSVALDLLVALRLVVPLGLACAGSLRSPLVHELALVVPARNRGQ